MRFWQIRSKQWAAIIQEVLGHAVACFVDEIVRHVAGFSCNLSDVYEFVIHAVVEHRALDGYGAIDVVPHSELDGFFPDFTSLARVAIGLDAHEGALEVAESV